MASEVCDLFARCHVIECDYLRIAACSEEAVAGGESDRADWREKSRERVCEAAGGIGEDVDRA